MERGDAWRLTKEKHVVSVTDFEREGGRKGERRERDRNKKGE